MNKQQEQSTVGRMDDDDSVSSNFYHEDDEEFLEEGGTRSEKRDELDEIKKMAQRETTRVRVWKGILLVVLGVTAALVTAGTYRILEQEEEEDFETAVSGRWQFWLLQYFRKSMLFELSAPNFNYDLVLTKSSSLLLLSFLLTVQTVL